MSRITVIGAGVVGQVYAGLLAAGGHDVIVVARGERAARLRTSGVVLEREGQKLRPECHIVGGVADAGTADVVIVAVRGDQLATVQPEVAACDAETIVCMANPLDQREDFLRQVGGERAVFAFSGLAD